MRLFVHAPVLIGLAAACTPTPSPLAWTIDFAPGAPRPPEVTAVRAWIRAGGCEGSETIYSAVLTPSGPMVATPPRLDDGTWGFGADALDAQCRTVASACEDVVTPSASSRVALLLEALDPPSGGCAGAARCEAGTCVGGLDAGAIDAGASDAGGADSGPMDSGGSCPSSETDCDDGVDDDCDAMTDCADPDCAGQTCAAGARCGGGVCCSTCVSAAGACVATTTRNACGSGGEACMRCAECVDCEAGRCAAPSAGTPCTGGVCVGSTSPTCCTGCVAGGVLTGTCEPGTTNAACGERGESCATCVDAVCTRNECCSGCLLSTGNCWPGTGIGNCGTAGAACMSCGAGVSCCDASIGTGGECVPGGCT